MQEDVVCTLTLTIMEHFAGIMIDNGERPRTLLKNLRGPTLMHFRYIRIHSLAESRI